MTSPRTYNIYIYIVTFRTEFRQLFSFYLAGMTCFWFPSGLIFIRFIIRNSFYIYLIWFDLYRQVYIFFLLFFFCRVRVTRKSDSNVCSNVVVIYCFSTLPTVVVSVYLLFMNSRTFFYRYIDIIIIIGYERLLRGEYFAARILLAPFPGIHVGSNNTRSKFHETCVDCTPIILLHRISTRGSCHRVGNLIYRLSFDITKVNLSDGIASLRAILKDIPVCVYISLFK